MVVGPLRVFGGSDLRCVQSSMDRSVVAEDEIPTMPTFPAASVPTVANAGLTAPAILAVWLTTHAMGLGQSKSTQNAMLFVSAPWAPHPLVQGPEGSTPYRGEPN